MHRPMKNLKSFRQHHRIQAQELALAANIDRSTLSRLECGWIDISEDLANKLICGYEKLNIDAGWISSHAESDKIQKLNKTLRKVF